MRDRNGIAARMEATSTLASGAITGGLPISAQLPGSRRPPLGRRLPRSVRLALVALDVVDVHREAAVPPDRPAYAVDLDLVEPFHLEDHAFLAGCGVAV